MLVNDKDALARLSNPNNLMNRLKDSGSKRAGAMDLFGINRKTVDIKTEEKLEEPEEKIKTSFNGGKMINPFAKSEPISTRNTSIQRLPNTQLAEENEEKINLDNILQDNEAQIRLGLAHDNALKLLNGAVDAMSLKLDEIKPDKLPSVISAASKVVESIRRERLESAKQGKDKDVHFHFYTPEQKSISAYEVIDVTQ